MSAVIETRGLGKRYRGRWALSDCTLSVPARHVVGLVGPNGAGKSTLMHLMTGLASATTGSVEVAGGRPDSGPAQLARVGFVAQDTPTYARLSVADHLRLGAHLNRTWDTAFATARIRHLDLDPAQKAGRLSGGQRAQLALTMAIAKRPELLILDEPVASLDPLARRAFLEDLNDAASQHKMSVVMSSHLLGDLDLICDYMIVLVAGHVQVAGKIDELLAAHRLLIGSSTAVANLSSSVHVISETRTDTRSTLVVRVKDVVHDPNLTIAQVSLEDLVLAYMSHDSTTETIDHPVLEAEKWSG
jgi:ABC-2 type transport system ATP-binding protein